MDILLIVCLPAEGAAGESCDRLHDGHHCVTEEKTQETPAGMSVRSFKPGWIHGLGSWTE